MAYVDEDMWTEALAEVESNVPGWVEPCECGQKNCDCDGSEKMAEAKAPQVGVPFNRSEVEVIIPTYVKESAAPKSTGACSTGACDDGIDGWYVEFRYPDGSEQYRTFIPFKEFDCD